MASSLAVPVSVHLVLFLDMVAAGVLADSETAVIAFRGTDGRPADYLDNKYCTAGYVADRDKKSKSDTGNRIIHH